MPFPRPAVLAASEACCALYIERGTTKLTVAEIAAAVGVPERTFYRWFAIKAETVKPVFDWTTATFNDFVAGASAALPLREVLVQGFDAMLGADNAERTRQLFPLVFADHEMWSVFLRSVHFGEISLAPVLAARLGEAADAVRPRAIAAAVAAATRIALEGMTANGDDPQAVFEQTLDAFELRSLGSP